MWNRMIARVGKFRQGEMSLARLVDDLRGLYVEADPHDQAVRHSFEQHWSISTASWRFALSHGLHPEQLASRG